MGKNEIAQIIVMYNVPLARKRSMFSHMHVSHLIVITKVQRYVNEGSHIMSSPNNALRVKSLGNYAKREKLFHSKIVAKMMMGYNVVTEG